MKCKYCGKEMGKVHLNRKYCSNTCYEKARYIKYGQRSTSEQRREWYKNRCKKKGYRAKLCKQIHLRHLKVLKFLRDYKISKGCIDCGYKKHHVALEFDHVKGKKYINVCFAKSIEQAKKEIEKCEVVCANCHRIRTFNRCKRKYAYTFKLKDIYYGN